MATRALSKLEISKRLIRLRNLEVLHIAALKRIRILTEENTLLKARILVLEERDRAKDKIIEELRLQLEELRVMVFGRKRDKSKHDDPPEEPGAPRVPSQRSRASYQRKTPDQDAITEIQEHPINQCNDCGGAFSERDRVTYYVEDIPLPQKKLVVKHVIHKGYCERCRKWSASIPLPVAPVILGATVKRYVTYLSVICRQSFTQIQDILEQTYDFALSQGEIAKILHHEGLRLGPEYERLKERIRGESSVHLDETSWSLLAGDGYRRYAWGMVGGSSDDAVFLLGKTRGKGNADDLLGNSTAVVVSDDYGAYRKCSLHQLCCAHILRKLRDLVQSKEIMGVLHEYCKTTYHTFARIYARIESARTSPDPKQEYDALHEDLRIFALPDHRDPAKLSRVKTQVRERTANYLTCLLYPGVASDNNRAERALRHLVLKRKISFGSYSEDTANTLAVLLSVLLSHKRRGTLRGYLMGV